MQRTITSQGLQYFSHRVLSHSLQGCRVQHQTILRKATGLCPVPVTAESLQQQSAVRQENKANSLCSILIEQCFSFFRSLPHYERGCICDKKKRKHEQRSRTPARHFAAPKSHQVSKMGVQQVTQHRCSRAQLLQPGRAATPRWVVFNQGMRASAV